ncbi:glycosyltransferase family 2 protein [Sporosalibacterium faouarense]|uniref:glycosyltransferase family 2 protein n=1 Tax=Sporosalibacterium faouarense TaxID=516123 RepID=UPI00141CC69B|nr:glycosyltransferase family 2 protein [Sporosalibacterium faouarense]MTI48180.1 glycosyltransferase family 2 protein [Bacillota bacterium]
MCNHEVVAVIPVYNEEDTIEETVNNLRKIDLINKIVVINDGSTDNTEEVVKNLEVFLINLEKNHGKGYAIKTALRNLQYDYIIFVDGDLGKTSKYIEELIYPVIQGSADATVAKFKPATRKGGFGLVKNLAKYGVYIYCGKKITSSLSGQRVYSKAVIDKINYIPNNFGIEIAMTIGTLRHGFKLQEIDVGMTHRESGRNLSGFIHRGRQFLDISKTLLMLMYRG